MSWWGTIWHYGSTICAVYCTILFLADSSAPPASAIHTMKARGYSDNDEDSDNSNNGNNKVWDKDEDNEL